jgi:hypothetical protein
MIPCVVNVDATPIFPISPWMHNALVAMAIIPAFSYDCPCPQKWAGYNLSGSHTTTVVHRNMNIMLESHNVGILVVHLTIPASPLIALHSLLSKRQMKFSSSVVQMDKKGVACSQLGLPPMPMQDCGNPVSNILTVYPLSCLNTVAVGMTGNDYGAGFLEMAMDAIIDLLIRPPEDENPLVKFLKNLAAEFLPIIRFKKWIAKNLVKSLAASIKQGELVIKIRIGLHPSWGNEQYIEWKPSKSHKITNLPETMEHGTHRYNSKSNKFEGHKRSPGNAPQIQSNGTTENLTSSDSSMQ